MRKQELSAMTSKRWIFALSTAVLLGATAVASAQDAASAPQRGYREPPPEALAACKGKAVGDEVSFQGRDGQVITATCVQMNNGALVARPAGRHRRRDGGPVAAVQSS
jgi:hypothetical protein